MGLGSVGSGGVWRKAVAANRALPPSTKRVACNAPRATYSLRDGGSVDSCTWGGRTSKPLRPHREISTATPSQRPPPPAPPPPPPDGRWRLTHARRARLSTPRCEMRNCTMAIEPLVGPVGPAHRRVRRAAAGAPHRWRAPRQYEKQGVVPHPPAHRARRGIRAAPPRPGGAAPIPRQSGRNRHRLRIF